MGSSVDVAVPAAGEASTGKVRTNFATIKTEIEALQDRGSANLLINGDFRVAQRGTAFTSASTPANNDDTYLLDRWLLLSDGNDVVDVNQLTDGGLGGYAYLEADVETVQKKFGFVQIIEQSNLQDLLSGSDVVTLSFKAKVSDAAKLDNIKAAVLSWTGTADSVTSDIVSAWNAADTTPTFATSWTAENAAANLSVTAVEATFKIENIAIDTSGVKNLAVFIWSDAVADNDTAGTKLHITDVFLEKGSVQLGLMRRPIGEELALCQRYFQRLNANGDRIPGQDTGTTTASLLWPFKNEMRATPTFALVTNGQVLRPDSNVEDVTGLSSTNIGTKSLQFNITVAGNLSVGRATVYIPGDITADAEL